MQTDPNSPLAEDSLAGASTGESACASECAGERSACCDSAALEVQVRFETEMNALKEQYARLFADMDNLRKRTLKDIEAAHKFGTEKLLADLLPVADSLDAGLNAGASDGEKLREGLELTQKQLLKAIEAHGLQVLAPNAGDAFDAELHQAVAMVEGNGVVSGAIVNVFQKGYRLHGRLLRPAMVTVAN